MATLTTRNFTVLPTLRGSDFSCLESIFLKGLLIPGEDECVQMRTGATHGRGIYTANLNAASLALGFNTGFPPGEFRMLVCAVAQTGEVEHIRDAQVIRDSSLVCPLLVAVLSHDLAIQPNARLPNPQPIAALRVMRMGSVADPNVDGLDTVEIVEIRRHPVWGDVTYDQIKTRVPPHRLDQVWSRLSCQQL